MSSVHITFKSYKDLMKYLSTTMYPEHATINYLPLTDEYDLWTGEQTIHVYQQFIEAKEKEVSELMRENKRLTDQYNNLKGQVEVCKCDEEYFQ